MSTLQTINVKHPSSGPNNVVLDSSGNTTVSGALTVSGNATIAGTLQANGVSGTIYPLTLMSAQNSTSGTFIDFTGIPSWARRISVMFNGVSTNGSSSILVQLGTSGGLATSGYISTSNVLFNNATANGTSSTAGFVVFFNAAADALSGIITINNSSTNNWVYSVTAKAFTNSVVIGAGNVAIASAPDRVRITTVNGTDVFDAGSMNVLYE